MTIEITILTHDRRWARLRSVLRAAVAETLSCQRTLVSRKSKKLDATSCRFPTVSSETGKTGVWHDKNGSVALTLVLTGDAEVQALNRRYRGKNKPTNVLSFPDGSEERGARGRTVRQLGDIAFAYETIAAEAAQQGKALKHHISHLAIHGTLHLLGFDHEEEAEAEAMEALEIAILARMGIANPYESE